jgi:phage baseplate assembly protein W
MGAVYDVSDPEAPAVASPEEDAIARLLRGSPRGVLGRGLIRPFQRDGKGDFVNASDATLVEAAIIQILVTRASSAVAEGEIPWRTEFGSWTYMLRHSGNDEILAELARRYVADAIRRWLPRVTVQRATIERQKNEQDDDVLFILVPFVIRRARDPRSDVVYSGTARAPLPLAA